MLSFVVIDRSAAMRVITPLPLSLATHERPQSARNFPMIQTRSLRSSITSGALRSRCRPLAHEIRPFLLAPLVLGDQFLRLSWRLVVRIDDGARELTAPIGLLGAGAGSADEATAGIVQSRPGSGLSRSVAPRCATGRGGRRGESSCRSGRGGRTIFRRTVHERRIILQRAQEVGPQAHQC
jgi:hypothetical protein